MYSKPGMPLQIQSINHFQLPFVSYFYQRKPNGEGSVPHFNELVQRAAKHKTQNCYKVKQLQANINQTFQCLTEQKCCTIMVTIIDKTAIIQTFPAETETKKDLQKIKVKMKNSTQTICTLLLTMEMFRFAFQNGIR